MVERQYMMTGDKQMYYITRQIQTIFKYIKINYFLLSEWILLIHILNWPEYKNTFNTWNRILTT
jgi:hypothetical protein